MTTSPNPSEALTIATEPPPGVGASLATASRNAARLWPQSVSLIVVSHRVFSAACGSARRGCKAASGNTGRARSSSAELVLGCGESALAHLAAVFLDRLRQRHPE